MNTLTETNKRTLEQNAHFHEELVNRSVQEAQKKMTERFDEDKKALEQQFDRKISKLTEIQTMTKQKELDKLNKEHTKQQSAMALSLQQVQAELEQLRSSATDLEQSKSAFELYKASTEAL